MKKLQNYFWICVVIIGVFIFKVGKRFMTDHLLENNPQRTKAVTIDERNYEGNHNSFSYSYLFKINGKKYKGNSHNPSLHVGDTIEVKYFKLWPEYNRPLHPMN